MAKRIKNLLPPEGGTLLPKHTQDARVLEILNQCRILS